MSLAVTFSPELTSFLKGPAGTEVVLTGTGFVQPLFVEATTTYGTDFAVVIGTPSETELHVVVPPPPMAAPAVTLRITLASGQQATSDVFIYGP